MNFNPRTQANFCVHVNKATVSDVGFLIVMVFQSVIPVIQSFSAVEICLHCKANMKYVDPVFPSPALQQPFIQLS